MGREVRRVPKDWKHPMKDGQFRPLLNGNYEEAKAEWDKIKAKWDEGLVEIYQKGWVTKVDAGCTSETLDDWQGSEPRPEDYMPKFESADSLMMYETTSEGTPLSPAFNTPQELARWLTDHEASAFGPQTASYEAWLEVCLGGWAPSAVYSPETGLKSGVEAMLKSSEDTVPRRRHIFFIPKYRHNAITH